LSGVEWGPFLISAMFVGFALFLIVTSGPAAWLQTPLTPRDGVPNESFRKKQLAMRLQKKANFRLIGLSCLVPAFAFLVFGVVVSM
jgi:hypothetical protein